MHHVDVGGAEEGVRGAINLIGVVLRVTDAVEQLHLRLVFMLKYRETLFILRIAVIMWLVL